MLPPVAHTLIHSILKDIYKALKGIGHNWWFEDGGNGGGGGGGGSE